MADADGLTDSFLALVDEAFRRQLDEPDAHLHVAGFAEGDVAFVLTRDGLEPLPSSLSGLNGVPGGPRSDYGPGRTLLLASVPLSDAGSPMRTRSVTVLLGVLALVAVLGLITPADAGGQPDMGNYVVVEKVVDGPVPEGTVFEIEVDCDPTTPPLPPLDEATPSVPDPDPVTLKFDANGDPIGPDMVSAPPFGTCKVTETDDGGARTVSYKCAVPPPPNGIADPEVNGAPVKCLDDQTVAFERFMTESAEGTVQNDLIGAKGTVTVTNTFEPEPPPAPAAPPAPAVVAARPAFTG